MKSTIKTSILNTISDIDNKCDRLRDEDLLAEIEKMIEEKYPSLIEKLND